MNTKIEFWTLLNLVQEYISKNYSAVLTESSKLSQLKAYIKKYLYDNNYECENLNQNQIIDKLYSEMAEYSILTPFLGSPDVEEINVNGYNDISITFTDGETKKLEEHFYSPQHEADIIKRLLRHSNMIIDNSIPIAQGHLPNNARITVLKTPLVDEDSGISASIRLLHPKQINQEKLIQTDFATEDMIEFLCMCARYGISIVAVGATNVGKTTLINNLLSSIPNNKRIFTIESGSRELSLIKKQDGKIINNVVHTLSRPSENPTFDISQEKLVVSSLRFNPDVICVGEMRDTECYAAVESSLTGHTVISSVHAGSCELAHMRIALLCQKRFPINFDISLTQAAQAFPIAVFVHKLEDNSRRIMEISECEILPTGERKYHTLYNYNIVKNVYKNEKYHIEGYFDKPCSMSDSLKRKLTQYGAPQELLNKFIKGGR